MSNHYAIKMMLGGVGAFVAFALDGRLSPGRADGQKVKHSEAHVFKESDMRQYPMQMVFLLTDAQ